jgi:hypothetical protein
MRCPSCDTSNPPEAVRCEECGKKLPARKPAGEPDEDEEGIEEAERRPVKARRRPPEDEDDEDDDDEEYERRPRRRSVRRPDAGEEVVSTIIPYKNPKALAGYYCGIFALFPILGYILGPIALTLGIMGLRYVRRKPEAHGTAHAIIAIIGGILGLLISLTCGTGIIWGFLHGFK